MRFLLLALALTLAGCTPAAEAPPPTEPTAQTAALDRLPDDEAGRIVRRAIERAGGWKAWHTLRTLDYKKTTFYYDEAGNETRRLTQHHQYQMQPIQKMRIAYTDAEGRDILLINNGGEAWKWIDGVRATAEADQNHAWNSSYGSHYVMGMPFKLTDPGAQLTYLGRETRDGVPVDAIQVDYAEGAGSAAGQHVWTYFFAADDGRLVANHLCFGPEPDDYDLTEYAELGTHGGVALSIRRVSYHSNAAKEKLGKASAYLNEDVRVNAPLPDSLFTLPRADA